MELIGSTGGRVVTNEEGGGYLLFEDISTNYSVEVDPHIWCLCFDRTASDVFN